MQGFPTDATTQSGKRVTLTPDDWLHVQFRHPEVGTDPTRLLKAVSHPDELFQDQRGGFHALKRIGPSHSLVVIYEFVGDRGLIRTAFIINEKRKKRRYARLRRVRQS